MFSVQIICKRLCAFRHIQSEVRRFSSKGLQKDFPWVCIPPYNSIKIDLNDSESKKKWAREGTKEEFVQLLASKSVSN